MPRALSTNALGRGITAGLADCEVAVDGPLRFVRIPDGYGYAGDWRLFDLECGDGASAALSVKSALQTLQVRRIDHKPLFATPAGLG